MLTSRPIKQFAEEMGPNMGLTYLNSSNTGQKNNTQRDKGS